MRYKRTIFIISLIILLYFPYKTYNLIYQVREKSILLKKRNAAWNVLEEKIKDNLAGFKGEAGIIIKDLNKDWQISHKENKLFPSASIVKIPIMASCFYAINEGKINSRDKIRLRNYQRTSGSGVLKNINEGKEFRVEELIELMITYSDNTAANMLIELLGFHYLNNSFKKLGLKYSNLSRLLMDFKKRKKGIENYTAARDIAYLLEKIYNNELLNSRISNKCLKLLKRQKIKDRIPARLPSDTIVAHKTGLEKGICHDAGIIFTDKGDFLICILTKHRDKNAKLAKEFIADIAFLTYKYSQEF